MILAVLTALEAASTTPADLVDRIFATHGVAAVAVSSEPRPFVFDGRRRDEVETANLARRWEIVVEPRYRAGRAVRLGQEAFFPQARADDEAVPDVPERALGQMGGTVVRVDQLLRGLQPPIELDPIYARRRVRVRLGVGGVEAALPGVARAVGARWEAKTRRIAFDPRTFRQSFLASVEGFSEGKAPGLADRRETMLRALAACSDADLTRAHKSETQWMFYVPFPPDAGVPRMVAPKRGGAGSA